MDNRIYHLRGSERAGFVYLHTFYIGVVCFYKEHFSRFRAKSNRPDSVTGAEIDSDNRDVRYFRDARPDSHSITARRGASRVRNLLINYTEKDNAVIFTVRVVPRASQSEIVGEHDGALKVRIASPPVDGAANAELIKLLAKSFDVPKSAIEIIGGQTSKTKQIKVSNINPSDFASKNLA